MCQNSSVTGLVVFLLIKYYYLETAFVVLWRLVILTTRTVTRTRTHTLWAFGDLICGPQTTISHNQRPSTHRGGLILLLVPAHVRSATDSHPNNSNTYYQGAERYFKSSTNSNSEPCGTRNPKTPVGIGRILSCLLNPLQLMVPF